MGQLFENRGPLSEFHSKILIAVAFGIIRPGQGEELHRVKSIRNVFAHAKIDVTFDTPQIAREIGRFLMLKAMKEEASKSEREMDFSNKIAYIVSWTVIHYWKSGLRAALPQTSHL